MKTAVIVACRMKSTRLPGKALLKIAGKTSIERCLEHAQRFPADYVILATSWLKEDEVLCKMIKSTDNFYPVGGHPENLFRRYLDACNPINDEWYDTFFRLSGDCPVASPEIAYELLKSHVETGADFTEAVEFATGTSCQVIQTEALRKLIELVPNPEYSEHMGLYFRNNPHIFKVNRVHLHPALIRNYRLTIDWQQDLDMFNALYKKLGEYGLISGIGLDPIPLSDTTANIFKVLDTHPEIAAINQGLVNVYEEPGFREFLDEKTRLK